MAGIFDLFDRISSKKPPVGNVEYIVAGLGNPGDKYDKTRHNAGFMAIDRLAEKCGVEIKTAKFDALIADTEISSYRVLLMKPQTFMNLSGTTIAAAAKFYKIPPENIIVIADDVNFEPSFMRIRRKGSAGGHNGLKDIIAKLGSENFIRIKLGVGKKPTPEYDMVDWVLGRFSESDMKALTSVLDSVACAVEEIIGKGVDLAMNKFSK